MSFRNRIFWSTTCNAGVCWPLCKNCVRRRNQESARLRLRMVIANPYRQRLCTHSLLIRSLGLGLLPKSTGYDVLAWLPSWKRQHTAVPLWAVHVGLHIVVTRAMLWIWQNCRRSEVTGCLVRQHERMIYRTALSNIAVSDGTTQHGMRLRTTNANRIISSSVNIAACTINGVQSTACTTCGCTVSQWRIQKLRMRGLLTNLLPFLLLHTPPAPLP